MPKKKEKEAEEMEKAIALKKSTIPDADFVSTGSTQLNLALTNRTKCGFPKGKYVLLVGDSESGKAQPLDAKIHTPSGWKTMGEMKVGMIVTDPSGGTAKVLGVFPQGKKDVYRITFSDGSSTQCCDDHLWRIRYVNRGGHASSRIVSLRDIRKGLETENSFGYPRHFIPMTHPVKYRWSCLPLHPYLIGALLGDGYLGTSDGNGGQIKFASADQEILDRVNECLPDGCTLVSRGGVNYDICGGGRGTGPSGVKAVLRDLGLLGTRSATKFIPTRFLRASIEDRISLLQGLMDTDGYSAPHCSEYSTVSLQLSNDFVELVQSLGGRATTRREVKFYSYNGELKQGQDCYTSRVILPRSINLFLLSRKIERYDKRNREEPYRKVVSVVKVGKKTCQCISVNTKHSLYLTDDFIVTHNTFFSMTCFAEAVRNPEFEDYRLIHMDPEDGASMDKAAFFGRAVADRIESPEIETVEDMYDVLAAALKEGKPFIAVVDSNDALQSRKWLKLMEKNRGKRQADANADEGQSYGTEKAKAHSDHLRITRNRLRKTGSILIIISQTRQTIGFGAMFNPKTRAGGNALKFFADLEIWTSVKGKIKSKVFGKDRQSGMEILVAVKKNRITGRKHKMVVPFLDDHGIDDTGGCVKYLIEEGYWKGSDKKVVAPEFDHDGSVESLVRTIEGGNKESKLRKLVGNVWREILRKSTIKRKQRYV